MNGRTMGRRWRRIAALAAIVMLGLATSARAEDKLRVGRAIQNSFTFALLDVGIANGIFKKHGLEIESVTFTGAAKVQAALTSNDLDIGLSTGQDMGFIVKGLPAMTVAAITNVPAESVMLVGPDSAIKTAADLKGKKIAVSNIRGYPAWLAIELSKHEGWGPDGMVIVATGSQPASMALLRTNQVDGWIGDIGTSIEMEKAHEGRILLSLGDVVPPFMNNAAYATNALIKNRPDLVRGFLQAWFENIAWATANRQQTVAIMTPILNLKPDTVEQIYVRLMPMQSTDGKFDPTVMAAMRHAIVDLGILDTEPDISKLYTEEFLPKM
jgi:sulfonate transport system substrate-binding protein